MAEINVDKLLFAEEIFLKKVCMPSHAYPSQQILASDCCHKYCSLHLRRVDLLIARYDCLKIAEKLETEHKKKIRDLLLSTVRRSQNGSIFFASLKEEWPTCPIILARVLGVSLHMLMSHASEENRVEHSSRDWYKSTMDSLATILVTLSKQIQLNSSHLMLPSGHSPKLSVDGSKPFAFSMMRKGIDLTASDTLGRCSCCTGLADMISKLGDDGTGKEAKELLDEHHRYVSQQRVVIEALNIKSVDPEFDLVTVHIDTMSNNIVKLPLWQTRYKVINDNVRIPIQLTTVQIGSPTNGRKHQNFEYPMIQGSHDHDAHFNVSVTLNSLLKMSTMPSVIVLILDSAPNNKCFATLAAWGIVLARLDRLKKVYLLYPCTGHTNLPIDSHFGNISQNLKDKEVSDLAELSQVLSSFSFVDSVTTDPTIYSFEEAVGHLENPKHLLSNSQILLHRAASGEIMCSCSSSIDSRLLFETGNLYSSFPLFKSGFDAKTCFPLIKKPDIEKLNDKVVNLLKQGESLLTDSNKGNYEKYIKSYGRMSFRYVICLLGRLPPKVKVTN